MDKRVMGAIEGLMSHGKMADFTAINYHILVGPHVPFRQVDRTLQRLRRRGLIAYSRKDGWKPTPKGGEERG